MATSKIPFEHESNQPIRIILFLRPGTPLKKIACAIKDKGSETSRATVYRTIGRFKKGKISATTQEARNLKRKTGYADSRKTPY